MRRSPLAIATLLFLIAILPVVAGRMYAPAVVPGSAVGNGLAVTVGNTTPLAAPLLHYEAPYHTGFSTVNETNGSFSIPTNETRLQGSYRYYVTDGAERVPATGALEYTLTRHDTAYATLLASFEDNESTNPNYCRPLNGTYVCGVESFQAAEIERFARLYAETGNATYAAIRDKLIAANWTSRTSANYCDPRDSDYDCAPVSVNFVPYSGAQRQAAIITDLWTAYRYDRSSTLRSLVEDYTRGSASDCDVWAGNFTCSTNSDQGLMLEAYATAYQATGNATYRLILESLASAANLSAADPVLGRGLALAGSALDNATLTNASWSILLATRATCESAACSPIAFSNAVRFATTLYGVANGTIDQPGTNLTVPRSYLAYRAAVETGAVGAAGSCSANDSSCGLPSEQAAMIRAYRDLARHVPYYAPGFYDVRYPSLIEAPANVTVAVKLRGLITSPKLYYKNAASPGNYSSITIDGNGTATLPSNATAQSRFLTVYFEDANGTRTPTSGTFTIPVALPYASLADKIRATAGTDPLHYCAPNDANSTTRFRCRYDYMQGAYLEGLGSAARLLANATYASYAEGLATTDIDPTGTTSSTDYYSTCDPAENDFMCESVNPNYILDAKRKPGALRTGSLIEGYLAAYQAANDTRALGYARALAYETIPGCDPWTNATACPDPISQATLLQAFVGLYRATGDDRLLTPIENLVNGSLGFTEDGWLATAHLTAQDYTATNLTSRIKGYLNSTALTCENDSACTPQTLAVARTAMWLGYSRYESPQYYADGNLLLGSRAKSDGTCDPNNPNPPFASLRYACAYPNDEGALLASLVTARRLYVNQAPPQLNVSIAGPSLQAYGTLANVTCNVTNTGTVTLLSGQLVVSTQHTIVNISANGTVQSDKVLITNLAPNATSSATIELNLTQGGRTGVRCVILSAEADHNITVNDIGDIINLGLSTSTEGLTTGHALNLTYANLRGFALENVTIELNLSRPVSNATTSVPIAISGNGTRVNLTFPLMTARENGSVILRFAAGEDGNGTIATSARSAFNGTSVKNLSFLAVSNALERSLTVSPSPASVFAPYNVSFSITNNKTYSLPNLTARIVASSNSTELVHVWRDGTPIAVSPNVTIADLAPNSTTRIDFGYATLAAASNSTITSMINLTSPIGISLSNERNLTITPNILALTGTGSTAPASSQASASFDVHNTGSIEQNVTISFSTSGASLVRIDLPTTFALINSTANLTGANTSANLSGNATIENLTSADNATVQLATNTSADLNVRYAVPNVTTTRATLSTTLSGTGPNGTASLGLLVRNGTGYAPTNCTLSWNATNRAYACDLTLFVRAPYLTNGTLDLRYELNASTNGSNLTRIAFDAARLVIGTRTDVTGVAVVNATSATVRLPILPAGASRTFNVTTLLGTSSGSLTGVAQSTAGGYARQSVALTVQRPPQPSASGGGGGGGSYSLPRSLEPITWPITLDAARSEQDYSTRYYLRLFEAKQIVTERALNATLGCLDARRSFVPVNITEQNGTRNVTVQTYRIEVALTNRCARNLSDVRLLESTPLPDPFNASRIRTNTTGFDIATMIGTRGILVRVSSLGPNATANLSYLFDQLIPYDNLSAYPDRFTNATSLVYAVALPPPPPVNATGNASNASNESATPTAATRGPSLFSRVGSGFVGAFGESLRALKTAVGRLAVLVVLAVALGSLVYRYREPIGDAISEHPVVVRIVHDTAMTGHRFRHSVRRTLRAGLRCAPRISAAEEALYTGFIHLQAAGRHLAAGEFEAAREAHERAKDWLEEHSGLEAARTEHGTRLHRELERIGKLLDEHAVPDEAEKAPTAAPHKKKHSVTRSKQHGTKRLRSKVDAERVEDEPVGHDADDPSSKNAETRTGVARGSSAPAAAEAEDDDHPEYDLHLRTVEASYLLEHGDLEGAERVLHLIGSKITTIPEDTKEQEKHFIEKLEKELTDRLEAEKRRSLRYRFTTKLHAVLASVKARFARRDA